MGLTTEDKQWILAQIEGLDAKVERFQAQIEGLDAKIERFQAQIEGQIERLDVKIERVETALLTEFHKWASPLEMRVRTHALALRATDLEVEALSDRVTKLEGGVAGGPTS